jgi:hypothetical protein
MAGLLEKIRDDIRGNLIGLLLASLFGGGLLTALAQGVRTMQNHPIEWRFVWIVFTISALALAVIILLAAKPSNRIQQSSQISIAPNQVNVGESAAAEINALFHRIDARFTADFTVPISQQANQVPAGVERDNYFVQAITVVLINLQLEILWYNIFGSQIRALERLNSQPLTRQDLFPLYTAAAMENPHLYSDYSFEQWLGFLRSMTALQEDGDLIRITVKGREFLRFMLDHGRSAERKGN